MAGKLKRVIKNPFILISYILLMLNLLRYRLIALIESKMYSGNLEIKGNIQYNHPVKFKGLGSITIEDNVCFGYELASASKLPIMLQPRNSTSQIHIGAASQIMQGCEFIAMSSIRIGKNCLIGPKTIILDADFHGVAPDKRLELGKTSSIIIEDNVWIGYEVMILKGVHIGKDAVIAARCVVTKDVPEGAIIAGNPMKTIGFAYA